MTENHRKVNMATVAAAILIITAVFGNIAIIDVRIMGLVPTYYRVIIPVLFVICCIKVAKDRNYVLLDNTSGATVYKVFFAAIAIWLIYGAASLFLSPWSVFEEGAKELLAIGLGLLSIYVCIYLCRKKQLFNMINILKICVVIVLAIGYLELFTGWHMSTSRMSDPVFISWMYQNYSEKLVISILNNTATGIFYNQNDFCAFLVIFAPLFLYYKDDAKLWKKLANYFIYMAIFLMALLDDAFICTVSLVLSLCFYYAVTKAKLIKWGATAVGLLCTKAFGGLIVSEISKFIRSNVNIQSINLSELISAQVTNMNADSGSMLYRINTYIEGIVQMFTQSKGLGLGAGSFYNYFAPVAEEYKMMSNPHSLWVEILSQYGVIVFVAVIAAFLYLFIKLFKRAIREGNKAAVAIMAMGVCLIFASFAPSSFIKNTYYWIVLGMALGLLAEDKISAA